MLTASRAWVRTSHAHSQGFGGGGGGGGGSLGHIGRCQKAHRRKLLMCSEGVKRDAGLWYSRKRKKRGGHLQEAEEGGGGSGAEEGEMTGKVERGVCPDMASSLSVCSDCGTSRTPLWRRGPAGPKSLCNACGIRYRKAKRYGATPSTAVADQRRNDGGGRKTPTPSKTASSSAGSIELRKEAKLRRRWETLWLLMEESGKLELSSGKEAVEAAMLLMAMSSGLFVHTY